MTVVASVKGNKKFAAWKLGIRSLKFRVYWEINTILSNDSENYEFNCFIISPVPSSDEHFRYKEAELLNWRLFIN